MRWAAPLLSAAAAVVAQPEPSWAAAADGQQLHGHGAAGPSGDEATSALHGRLPLELLGPVAQPEPWAAAAEGAPQCSVSPNADCQGSDLPGVKAEVVETAAECCTKCHATKGCGAFTWHGTSESPPHACYLKSDCQGAARAANIGGVAGVTHGAFPPFDADPHCNHGHSGPSPAPPTHPLPNARPPPENRSFVSPAIERRLSFLVHNKTWRDPNLATMLWNCLPNTLDTTVWAAPAGSGFQPPAEPNPQSFVSTGDQASMYLRDSQNQVMPYVRFAKEEPDGIGAFLRGILLRYVNSVLLDPYANSFDYTHSDRRCNMGAWTRDNTTRIADGKRVNGMLLGIHQRKWEMDSLCSVLKLGRLYYEATGDARPFDARWREAVRLIIHTFRAMQAPLDPTNFTSINYTFQTLTTEPKDTAAHGIGRNHRWTGMIRTLFMPSDDSTRLPYFVPANAFAVTELLGTARLLQNISKGSTDEDLARQATDLANEVDTGIREWGIVTHSSGSKIFAMEVDGFGNFFFGDDANVPSLLALPFYGYINASDPLYLATRKLLLSNRTNPYFYGCGSPDDGCGFLGGIGSEDASGNAGLGRVWGLSLCTRLLTVAGDGQAADAERLAILKTAVMASGGTGLMHESYWFEDSSVYTRFWFAMANSYMGMVLLDLAETKPHLLFTDDFL